MKRTGNLFGKICSLENLRLADDIARLGKRNQHGVIKHDKNREANILELHDMLWYKEYSTGGYNHFQVTDRKVRNVSSLTYYPHRIVQQAIMNILEPIIVASFTSDTYSCIKGKGVGGFDRAMKVALKDVPGTQFCLKLDVKKFYENIDHYILKQQLRRKFKDPDLLWLLDDIIDSVPAGVPIGNHTSQYFANFNLSPLDHFLKEQVRVEKLFRYCDDIIILAHSKEYLHAVLALITEFLEVRLNLQVKSNYQIFPVDDRGIDVCGRVYFHGYTLLRKDIKKNFARAVAKRKPRKNIVPYWGWAKYCNSGNLMKKLFPDQSLIAA